MELVLNEDEPQVNMEENTTITMQQQLWTLFNEPQSFVRSLNVPENMADFVRGKSSRGRKLLLPKWVSLQGHRYVLLEEFPKSNPVVKYHMGAQCCVAAYELSDVEICSDLPMVIALKCAPFGLRTKHWEKSPWACEYRIHNYLKQYFPTGQDAPFVEIFGACKARVERTTQVYLAMELLDTDLFSVVERSHRSDNFGAELIYLMLRVCLALDKLHSAGIIYCDLKPENVLVSSENRGMVKFGDFDRSRIPSLKMGVVGGTRGYYSPERMSNYSLHSVQDDIWAFGVMFIVGATSAASPYLDMDLKSINDFVPSEYLIKHAGSIWTPQVGNRVATLLDQLLAVNPKMRPSLSYVASELQQSLAWLRQSEVPPLVSTAPNGWWETWTCATPQTSARKSVHSFAHSSSTCSYVSATPPASSSEWWSEHPNNNAVSYAAIPTSAATTHEDYGVPDAMSSGMKRSYYSMSECEPASSSEWTQPQKRPSFDICTYDSWRNPTVL